MNKLISTKNLFFISMAGPSETGKSQIIYNWLKNGTLQSKLDNVQFFYQHFQIFYVVMQKEIENLEFVRGVNFEFIDSLKNNGTKNPLIFDDSCQESCNSKKMLILLLLANVVGWVLFTISTTSFIKAKLGETMSFRTLTLFFSSLTVMWCKSVRLVHNWDSEQS